MTGSVLNNNTIYFKSGTGNVNSITLTNGSDVKDAAGNTVNAATNALELYLDSVADENKLTVTEGTFSVTCPTTNNYTGTYSIIAKDFLGNQTTLATFTLDGSKPTGNVTYKLTENDETTAVDNTYYYVSGDNIGYNTTQVKKLVVTISDVEGSGTVTVKAKEGSEDATVIDGSTHTFTLPTTAGSSKTYKVIAVDCVGNETVLKEFTVTANELTGCVTFDTTQNASDKVIYDATKTPKEIYFKHGDISNIKLSMTGNSNLYYQIGTADAVNITNTKQLPCPTGDDYTVTYKILVGSDTEKTLIEEYTIKGYSPTGTISIAEDAVGKQTGSGESATWAAATAAGTNAGGYIMTTDTPTTPATVTIKYNPSLVNMVKLSPTVTDCGAGSKIVVKSNNPQVEDTVNYVSDVVVPVTLESSWTDYERTYEVYAVDNVGNETKLKTYKFRAFTTAPTINANTNVPYGDLENKNTIRWDYGSGSEVEVIGYVIPKDSVNGISTGSVTGGTVLIISNDITFNVPISNPTALVSSKLSYRITSTHNDATDNGVSWSSNITTDWQPFQSLNNNAISITVKPSDIPYEKTYIFIWLQDELGNANVYNLMCNATHGGKTRDNGWWKSTASNNASINTIGGFTSTIRGVAKHTNTDSTSSSQLSQSFSAFAPISNLADTVTKFAPVKEIKQIAKPVEPVIERSELAQKQENIIEAIKSVELVESIEPAESIAPLESITSVESVAQPVNKIIDSLPVTDNIEKLAGEEALELPQVNAQISEPVVQSQSQLESQRSLYDDSELKAFDMRSVYAAIAVLIVALSALGGIFITRAKKMKK